jgi:hypothetical protein
MGHGWNGRLGHGFRNFQSIQAGELSGSSDAALLFLGFSEAALAGL